VRSKQGELIAMNRNGIMAVVDDKGREKERYPAVYGARGWTKSRACRSWSWWIRPTKSGSR
jgi:hypothetical protein